MRSNNEYREILRLWESGLNKSAIARKSGIPRGTIRDCIKKFGTLQELEDYLLREQKVHWTIRSQWQKFRVNYSYMLGIYLGDGYIATHPRTYRLRIAMDVKYPNIIQQVMDAMAIIVPNNSIHTREYTGCLEIACYSNHWIEIFPQHGEGVKHTRDIILEDWQQTIVDEYPIEFVRGLIHSDGCHIEPVTNGKIYSRYEFKNVSDDIHKLFCDTVEKLGLSWTRWGRCITIARRPDVAFLDKHIGPKS